MKKYSILVFCILKQGYTNLYQQFCYIIVAGRIHTIIIAKGMRYKTNSTVEEKPLLELINIFITGLTQTYNSITGGKAV